MSEERLKAYLRFGQRFVNGWLRPGAAETIVALDRQLRSTNVAGGVAEIGVHHGKLFILLYLLCSGDEAAVAVDIFSQQHLNVDHSGAGNLEIFTANLKKHADLDRLVVQEGDSTLLNSTDLVKLGRGPLRLISIDGGHTEEITAHDLATAEGALAEGGIIILDDCFTEVFPGVSDGVHTYFLQPRTIVPFGIASGKTFFCHPEYASRYMAALRTMSAKITEHGFLRTRVVCLEYSPLTLAERVGKVGAWRKIRHLPPARMASRAFHSFRSMMLG
jgi:hypothetical protein